MGQYHQLLLKEEGPLAPGLTGIWWTCNGVGEIYSEYGIKGRLMASLWLPRELAQGVS